MTETRERYALATPETTGPGAMVCDGRELYEVREERRRDIKVGERIVSLLERRLANVGEDDSRFDAKRGRTVGQDTVWRPMAELREWWVVRPADSPLA